MVRRSARRLQRLLLWSVGIVLVLVWAAWAEIARHDRTQAVAAAARRQANLLTAVSHYLGRALSNADALGSFLARAYTTPGTDFTAALSERAAANELFTEMVLCGNDGLGTSTRPGGDRRAWCGEWLRVTPVGARNHPAPPVGEQGVSHVPLLTHLPATPERPAGVLALLVEVPRLLGLLQDYSIPDETVVLVLGADGVPRARWHSQRGMADQRAPEAALLPAVAASRAVGQLHAVDGQIKVVSARTMPARPLVLMVATDLTATLADPHRRARQAALVAALVSVLLPLFALVLLRLQGRIAAMAEDLGDAHARLQALNAQLEEEVRARTAELEQAYQELETFSYTVAHDVRAPLATIAGFAQALQDAPSTQGDARAMHFVRRIQANAAQMNALTEALLALGKLTRASVVSAPVDLSELAAEVLAGLRERDAGARDAQVDVQPGIVVSADPVLMRQVLENVLGNAWKFTARRMPARIRLDANPGPQEGWTTIRVEDNGEGFDASQVRDPFKPFQRMHDAAEFPGTGIGLATVERIVRLHGGTVAIASVPEAGTTVSFTLPVAPSV
ncbi:MAG TPA: ATP-binding protein [Ramlibacter sp.]|nr:ATP-binding protein [Ramlibacter sp.]